MKMTNGEGGEKLRFAIIGAGMSGILSAIKLREAGFDDFAIYEKASRLGGTWRENTYPGIACDVPSHLYSYSFAPNPEWSHHFSPGAEIQAYFEKMARDYDVEDFIRFGSEITRCHFREGRWYLATDEGPCDEVDFVIAATGVLHHPSYPDIEGLDRFERSLFHSARWDHDVALENQRVGIIGTGSTAVQVTAELIDRVKSLSLFQRTAQWIMPQENPAYTESEKRDFREKPEQIYRLRDDISVLFAQNFANAVVDADSPQMKLIEETCRQNLELNVKDPVLREQLRPNYRAACKRLVISPDFYQAIQKSNAELVTSEIANVEPKGVRTQDGRLHELDVLVLATGFRVDRFMRPIELFGIGNKSLEDAWAERPAAYLSISIPDFPNFFMLNGPNGPVGNFSLIEVAELQMAYIIQLVNQRREGRCRYLCASQEALENFDAARTKAAKSTVWTTGCRSWYLDDRGIPAAWPWTFDHFREAMERPDLAAFDLIA